MSVQHNVQPNIEELKDLSMDELEVHAATIQKMIAEKKDSELRAGFQQVVQIAKNLNVSVEELIAFGNKKPEKIKVRRKPVDAKYKNPNNASEVWAGRGKQPTWLVELLKKPGAKIQDFLIHHD